MGGVYERLGFGAQGSSPDFEYLGVGFVTEISEIAISNYLKLVVWIAISKFKFGLQPNYSHWGVN